MGDKYIYIAAMGDTWDSISYKMYGNEFMCDDICKANSRELEGVIMFEGGEEVIIPDVVSSQLNVIKAPWE